MYPNILVVEDDRKMRIVIKRTLVKIGLGTNRVYEAVNGENGLEILRRCDVDLVLTDINMPVMDGLEMLGHMRSNPDIPEIPTVVITSKGDDKLVNAVTQSGLGFIQKPFTWQIFKEQILKLKKNRYGNPA